MPFTLDDYATNEAETCRVWNKKIDKKYYSKGTGIWVLHKRTLNTALHILRNIANIEFVDISLSLYIYCKDVPAFDNLLRKYESILELAAANPEMFIEMLHLFYVEQAASIKSNKLYQHFFELLGYCQAHRDNIQSQIAEEKREQTARIFNTYEDLLLQQMEYLRPNPFDYNTMIYGIRTDGSLIIGRDRYPSLDIPKYIVEHEAMLPEGKGISITNEYLSRIFAKYGYMIHDQDDVSELNSECQTYTSNVYSLLPYINEYTFDILPQTPLAARMSKMDWPMLRDTKSMDQIMELLSKHKKRTLPANGARMEIGGSDVFKELFIREIFHNDHMVLLYRLSVAYGDISGFYDSKMQWFYSAFYNSSAKILHESIRHVVLWFYASIVCNSSDITPTSECFSKTISEPGCRLSANFFSIGGRLRNTLDNTSDSDTARKMDRDKYEAETKSVNGYVRRLPAGQKASERASQIASDLGFELSDNETFVQPFMKSIWILKDTNYDPFGRSSTILL